MRRYGNEKYSVSVTSANWVTIAEYKLNSAVDRVVVAIHNTYTGINLDELEIQVLGQLVPGGDFFDVGPLQGNGGVNWLNTGLKKSMTYWGAIDDFGFEVIRIQAKRAGPDPIPVTTEIRCLAEGIDG